MNAVSVIYWSGTGNTAAMAQAVAEGARAAGAQVRLLEVSQASPADALDCGALALGCPAMGAEVLEEAEFEPYFQSIEPSLSGRTLALFGSYGWATANGCGTGTSALTAPAPISWATRV